MSILKRQVLHNLILSIVLLIVFTAIFTFIFPLPDWQFFIKKEIMDIPLIVYIPFLTILIGISGGVWASLPLRRKLNEIQSGVLDLEQGRLLDSHKIFTIIELTTVWNGLVKVQEQINRRTKQSQKLVNEKAEEQEKRIQEIVSQERNRLARELHDSVSQQLFAASMMMSAINESKKAEANPTETKQLKMVEEMIHQSQLEMRALLLHLRPVALKGKTLKEGIQELLVELSNKVPMEVDWKVEDIALDKGIEDHLFRILQESVSNTLRHSKASSLEVLLIKRDSLVILRVMDDGIGFDSDIEKTGSYGLQNMQERALEIGGSFKIVSVPNKGTRLEVKVPMVGTEGDE
ncbi:sensor histidine kinase [Rossellomorea vietnamensis]|uniref:Sensor histidine kinase n=1 Tax=Rossellomorea vietnamensis TaxID=218284 RepID=A0A5D4NQ06_9BACI|nr:sensor histidine kinase [Rossellomorea vietnamensis]TYS14982.1 sensor histidine kinase [Rossellomorea vietnamensis]